MDTNLTPYAHALATDGWTILPQRLPDALVDTIVAQLPAALAKRDAIRQRNGQTENTDGTIHHFLTDHECNLAVLKALQPYDGLISEFFHGKYIVNSYGGLINRQGAKAYVHNVHRDIRFFSAARHFMLNILVMLDDFTLDNGATHLLSGSHLRPEKPDDDYFYQHAARALGQRGSLLLFDSRLWHATGDNRTQQLRRALTITLTSPFFKQQLDYPRALGDQHPALQDAYLRQITGYNARVPSTLEEFYVPLEQRFYQRGQDE